MKKKKLNLKELQIESFITSSNLPKAQTPVVKGGTFGYPLVQSDYCTPECPQWLLDQIAKEAAALYEYVSPAAELSINILDKIPKLSNACFIMFETQFQCSYGPCVA